MKIFHRTFDSLKYIKLLNDSFEIFLSHKKFTTWTTLTSEKALTSHEERTGTWPPRPVESDKWS